MQTQSPITDRKVIAAMARCAMHAGDFVVLREVITLSEIGTPQEQEQCVAEWEAYYHKREFSVFPQHGHPRDPRPYDNAWVDED